MRTLALLFLAPLLALADDSVTTIHVLPGSHLDIGFTDTPDAVREKRIRVLDDAIAAAKADPEFRWFEEGGWVVDAWREKHKGEPERIAELATLMQAGRISMGAAWANPHAGMFAESLDLLFFQRDDFAKTFGVSPAVAVLNDVPSYPEALVDAMAARGIRYLLVGANMAFTAALPPGLAKAPFWWESAAGNRILVVIDDDAYTAAYMKWGIDPDCARFFNPKEFPAGGAVETMEAGVSRMLKTLAAPRDEVIVEHAFDNWDCANAKKLPGFIKQWNDAGKKPRIVLGGPEAYFRHIEEKYGKDLPVRKGEWGGQWDAIRASSPVWTWRLRRAMAALPKDASLETRAALATAMEHSQGLGPGWGGMFTEEQTAAHAKQVAALFGRAVEGGRDAAPEDSDSPQCDGLPEAWKACLASPRGRMRVGQSWLGPFVFDQAPEFDGDVVNCFNHTDFKVRAMFDRKDLKGSDLGDVSAVIEIPLKGAKKTLSIAPEGSPARWLLGGPPAFVVAPGGLRITGLAHPLVARSPLVFSWTLVADRDDPNVTWLQGLVVRQSFRCEFKDKSTKALPFETLYPGEPSRLVVEVRLRVVEEK